MKEPIPVNPDVLRWARETAGLTRETPHDICIRQRPVGGPVSTFLPAPIPFTLASFGKLVSAQKITSVREVYNELKDYEDRPANRVKSHRGFLPVTGKMGVRHISPDSTEDLTEAADLYDNIGNEELLAEDEPEFGEEVGE